MATKSERKPTKKQLLDELHERLGKCRALIEDKAEPRQCTNWAVNERGYCGTHYASALEKERKQQRADAKRAQLDAAIDRYLADEPRRQQETLDWAREHMSLLDDMTKGITAAGVMDRKAEKASKLTPVAGEEPTTIGKLPDAPGVFMTAEALAMTAGDLRTYAAQLTAIADGLDTITKLPSSPEATTGEAKRAALDVKAAEKAADERAQSSFEAMLAQKSAAAQAATFASMDAGADEGNVSLLMEQRFQASEHGDGAMATDPGWFCPTHGDKAIVTLKAKGRTIRACDKCDQVES